MKRNFFALITKILLICLLTGILSSIILELNVQAYENQNSNLIEKILQNKPDIFGKVLKDSDKYDVQILYTQINRDVNNTPSFKSFKYNVDKNKYFYPASSVKLSACALALEKLNNLGIDKSTPAVFEKGRPSQKACYQDQNLQNKPTIENYIKKILVASDNEGFDKLYEFLGQQYYNETLWKKGYKDTMIVHRLCTAMGLEENRYTNPVKFYDKDKVIYSQPILYNSKIYKNSIASTKKGKGYKRGGRYISNPKDFSRSNYFSIECLQGVLKAIMFPESVPEQKKFNLKQQDYEFLRKYMCMLPRECSNPKYNLKDNYVKYFMYGDKNSEIPQNMKIYNKIGCAYGYLVDNAYIKDTNSGVEFMLTAVICSNKNEIFDDGKYEYNTVGMPFLGNLGREIFNYEVNGRKI